MARTKIQEQEQGTKKVFYKEVEYLDTSAFLFMLGVLSLMIGLMLYFVSLAVYGVYVVPSFLGAVGMFLLICVTINSLVFNDDEGTNILYNSKTVEYTEDDFDGSYYTSD